MIKIAFYGKSGVGKSTVTSLAIEYFREKEKKVEILKFAYPLYDIQNMFYKYANINIEFFDQNQILLESIANQLRDLNYNSLIEYFNSKLFDSNADIIINDDVRDVVADFPYLIKNNFKLIRINCDENIRLDRLKQRNDLNSVINSNSTADIDSIKYDYCINTTEIDIELLKKILYEYLNEIYNNVN